MYKSSLLFSSSYTTIRQYGSNTKLYTTNSSWYSNRKPVVSAIRQYNTQQSHGTHPACYSVPTIREYGSTIPTERPVVCSIRQYNTRQSQCTGTNTTAITTIRLQQIQLRILFLQYNNTAVRFQQKALWFALYGNTTPDKVNAQVLPPQQLRQYVYNKSSFVFSSYNTTIRQYGSNRKPCGLLYTAIQHRQSQCTGTTTTAITTIRLQQIQLGIMFLQYHNTAVRFQQ